MDKQTKTAQLEARKAEAIATAKEQETQAKSQYETAKRTRFAARFLIVWAIARAKELKARQRYEKAQENRLNVIRQYAAILAAVPTDYSEINTLKA